MRTSGIGAILDYAAEQDVAAGAAVGPAEDHSAADAACDDNAATTVACIQACVATRASPAEPSFAAVKVLSPE